MLSAQRALNKQRTLHLYKADVRRARNGSCYTKTIPISLGHFIMVEWHIFLYGTEKMVTNYDLILGWGAASAMWLGLRGKQVSIDEVGNAD